MFKLWPYGLWTKLRGLWPQLKPWVEGAVIVATVIPVLVSAVYYLAETKTRERSAILAAWSLLVQMEAKRPDAGRTDALRELQENGVSLAGLVLNSAILHRLDLQGADLAHSEFNQIECRTCSFRGSHFSDADLSGGEYKEGCDFRQVRFERVQIGSAVLADCNFDQAILHQVTGDDHTSFNGAVLRGSVISNTDLSRSNFDNADLENAHIINSSLIRASFQKAVATGWRWMTVTASHAQLNKIHGDNPVFAGGTVLSFSQLDGADLRNAVFEYVDLRGARFFGAKLSGAKFRKCDLSGADFTSSNLEGVTFEDCRIEGAIFRRAILDTVHAFVRCQGNPAVMP